MVCMNTYPIELRQRVVKAVDNKIGTKKEIAKTFEAAIGVRNILVHQYESVDPNEVYTIIQNNLSDFDRFVIEIADYLEREKTTR